MLFGFLHIITKVKHINCDDLVDHEIIHCRVKYIAYAVKANQV